MDGIARPKAAPAWRDYATMQESYLVKEPDATGA